MNHKVSNSNSEHLCLVCEEVKTQLFEIADCGHLFCADCCITYIKSQAQNFAKARCLQEGCLSQLNKNKPIYMQLDPVTINRIQNYKLFIYLQGNKEAAACRKKDCKGYFLKSSEKPLCTICGSEHCKLCLQVRHSGLCVSKAEEQQEMRKLNYRKCPKCAIWVEKINGCEYISCKCGVEFCYRCGEEYTKDPCRKREIWKREAIIRKLMKMQQLIIPSDVTSMFLFVLRVFLMITVIVPFTVMYCVIPLLVGVVLIEIFICLFMPAGLFYVLSSQQNCECKWLGYIALVLFYPVIGALFAIIAFFIMLAYPCAKNKYHHGVYDPLDNVISYMAVLYLQVVNAVVMCCV